MKQHWERSIPTLHLNEQSITLLLKKHFPDNKLVNYKILSGGLANTNYKCTLLNNSNVVLRIFTRSKNICLLEKKMYEMFFLKIPMAKILYYDVNRYDIPYEYSVIEWVDGISLRDAILMNINCKKLFYNAGYLLHYLTKFSFSKLGKLNDKLKVTSFSTSINPYLEYNQKMLNDINLQKRIGKKMCKNIQYILQKQEYLYFHLLNSCHLSHGDYDPANIFISKDAKKIIAILDWEFAFSGTIYNDIGNMLRYQHLFPKACVACYILGIQTAGIKLHSEWLKIAKLADLTNLLTFMNSKHEEPKKHSEIIDLLDRMFDYF